MKFQQIRVVKVRSANNVAELVQVTIELPLPFTQFKQNPSELMVSRSAASPMGFRAAVKIFESRSNRCSNQIVTWTISKQRLTTHEKHTSCGASALFAWFELMWRTLQLAIPQLLSDMSPRCSNSPFD